MDEGARSVDTRNAPTSVGPSRSVVVIVAGYPLQQFYLSNRYESVGAGSAVAPKTVAWVQTISNSRIALGGSFMNLQYPYYGKYLNNWVQFISTVSPNGAMANPTVVVGSGPSAKAITTTRSPSPPGAAVDPRCDRHHTDPS